MAGPISHIGIPGEEGKEGMYSQYRATCKSSQVKLLISIGTNKCAKQRAQHNKTKNAACDALMKLQT